MGIDQLLKIELLCLKQFYYFSRRHRRYFLIFLGMYLSSLFCWKRTRLLRAGYCFIQLLDDILDGDRAIDVGPGVYAESILKEIVQETFSKSSDASTLIGFVFEGAKRRPDFPTIKHKFAALVSILIDDYIRRTRRRTDLAVHLAEHHRQTFKLSMDITLAFLDSRVNSADCPEIVDSLVWCSVMRDLRDDLKSGIINIPRDIYQVPSHQLSSEEIETILQEPNVQTWIRCEFASLASNMQAIEPKLHTLKDNIGKKAVKIFWKSIKSYVPKFERQNRALLSSV